MCDQVYLTIRSDNLLIFFLSIKKKNRKIEKRKPNTGTHGSGSRGGLRASWPCVKSSLCMATAQLEARSHHALTQMGSEQATVWTSRWFY
jgi:hypothetical protein